MPSSFLLIVAHAACDENALEPPRECTAPMVLSVSSGAPPQFTWTVPCAVARLVVLEPPSLELSPVAWDIRSTTPRIVSPVRYGDRPLRTTEEHAPEALRSGETYQVRVFSGAQIVIGSASFTP